MINIKKHQNLNYKFFLLLIFFTNFLIDFYFYYFKFFKLIFEISYFYYLLFIKQFISFFDNVIFFNIAYF